MKAGSALIACLALSLFLATLVSQGSLTNLLVRQYGGHSVGIHFSSEVYAAWLIRARAAAALILLAAAALFWMREYAAQAARTLCVTLQLSFKHASRRRHALPSFFRSSAAAMLSVILIAAAVLRLKFLALPMRVDETTTFLTYASKPLYIALSVYEVPNNHVFHTMLVHLATATLGAEPWAIRLPAFLAGSLLPALIFLLLKTMGESEAGLLAAALVACSSVMVEYSTNARGYTIVSCCTAILFCSAYACAARAAPVWFLVFAMAAVAGFYAVPVMLFPFVAALVWMVWLARDARRHRRALFFLRLAATLAAVGAGAAALYLPVLLVSGPHALLQNPYLQPVDLIWFTGRNLFWFAETWQVWNRDLPPGAPVLLSAASVLALLFPSMGGRLRSLVIATLGSSIVLLAAGRFAPQARIWLMFQPLYFALAASAFASAAARLLPGPRAYRRAMYGLTVAWLALAAWRVAASPSIPESKGTGGFLGGPEVAEYLDRHQIPLKSVIRTGRSDMPLRYYLWRKSGRLQASAAQAQVSGESSAWCVANEQFGETPESVLGAAGLTAGRIIEAVKFRSATLYRLEFQ